MNLEQITQNLFTLSDAPFILISKFGVERKYIHHNIPHQMKGIIKKNREYMKQKTIDYLVYRFKDVSELAYCSFKVLESTIIMGPFLEKKVSSKSIKRLCLKYEFTHSAYSQLEAFYQSLTILSESELDFIYNVISNITHTKFRPPEFTEISPDESQLTNNQIFEDELLMESEQVKQNFNVEKQFTSIIENGDVYKAEDFNASFILSDTPEGENISIQDEKMRLTILETLCNRAAIRGGIDIQFAHQLSKKFEISIDAVNSIKDSEDLSQDIITEYTWVVKNFSLSKFSVLIRNAVLYIRRNVTSSYGLSALAHDLQITKEHLSREFKKETGETVSSYIQYSKVLEAIKMLEIHNYTISQISNLLGFSSSAYFTKIFKKHMGLSPKQYASRNIK